MAHQVVFSLWSGPLPQVAELHFRSTLHHLKGGHYHLFLDTTPGYEGIITPEFEWLKTHPQVTIRHINVVDYVRSHGIFLPEKSKGFPSTATLRLWYRRVFLIGLTIKKLVSAILPALGNKLRVLPHGVHNDPVFGITAGHGFPAWRQAEDLSYRADIFRVLAPEFFPEDDVLWLDLDIAVTKDLTWLKGQSPLVYRWGLFPFSNNAMIFLPHTHPEARAALVEQMNRLGAARPWTLFSDEVCEIANIAVLDVDEFDPPWTEGHLFKGDYEGLFTPSDSVTEIVTDLLKTTKMIHWHNHWKNVPPADSPLGMMTEIYREKTAAKRAKK
jgi:hypothetical protein